LKHDKCHKIEVPRAINLSLTWLSVESIIKMSELALYETRGSFV